MGFPFTTALRLEIEDPTLDVATRNLIPGADNLRGPYGWVTPSGLLAGSMYADGTAGTGAATYGPSSEGFLDYTTPTPSGPAAFYSIPAAVTPGQYVAAQWGVVLSSGTLPLPWYRAQIEFLGSTGSVVGTSTVTPYASTNTATTASIASTVVPATAVTARLRFDIYATSTGGNPIAGQSCRFDRVRFITRPTAITLPISSIQNNPVWRNLLTSATEITVEREALNVGTLAATIPDATYDPALNALIRPGRRLRLSVHNGSGQWYYVFSGLVAAASVQYDPLRTGPKRAVISLSATDAAATLANAARPVGVATISDLRTVLEGAGVPWYVNGSTQQVSTATAVTRNESASALDQVAITRDSRHGYAWVDPVGRLIAYDAANMPTTTVGTFTDGAGGYGDDLDVSFDLDAVINLVTIRHLRLNAATGQTVEVPYGPFRHEASIRDWGVRAAEFTVQGLTDTTAAMQTFADEVFAASAVPVVRVNALSLEVRGTSDTTARAMLDLYDKVRVTNTATSLDQTVRITSITHRIRPKGWVIELGFGRDGGVASPQQTPALVSQPTITAPPSLTSGTYTGTTNANGVISIPHGLGVVPGAFVVTPLRASAPYVARWDQPASTSTGALVHLTASTTNANAASVSVSVAWIATP